MNTGIPNLPCTHQVVIDKYKTPTLPLKTCHTEMSPFTVRHVDSLNGRQVHFQNPCPYGYHSRRVGNCGGFNREGLRRQYVRQLTSCTIHIENYVVLVVRAMVGDDKNLMDPLFRSMIRAADLAGTIDLACDVSDSDKIVGMAVWFGPGKSLFAE